MMTDAEIEARLSGLGLVLPEPAAPVAAYVPVVVAGGLAHVSGQLPFVDGKLVKAEGRAYPAVAAFTDATPARWLNPGLRFGGVAVPDVGFSFRLTAPKPDAPPGARVKVWFDWN